MFMPLLLCSDAGAQRIVDSDPYPLVFPDAQVMIDALPLGEIGRQHAPLDPALGDIKDGRMFHMCWSLSDGSSKLIPIDEESNHQIMHALRLGETDGAAYQPFDPRP